MQRWLGAIFLMLCTPAWGGECAPDRADLRGNWGAASFRVELADTEQARAEGLMFREKMPRFSGMLFVYPRPQRASFWMKNTLIPLDMLFMDESGIVLHIHHQAVPGDLTPIDGGKGILAVLEINGGLAAALKIDVGSQLRHPVLADKAAWPCTGDE